MSVHVTTRIRVHSDILPAFLWDRRLGKTWQAITIVGGEQFCSYNGYARSLTFLLAEGSKMWLKGCQFKWSKGWSRMTTFSSILGTILRLHFFCIYINGAANWPGHVYIAKERIKISLNHRKCQQEILWQKNHWISYNIISHTPSI